jgi:hypothetical protein
VSRKLITAATTLASGAMAIAIGGCGATKAISGAVDPVARAATTTAHVPGYRMSVSLEASGASATVHGTMSGVIDSARHMGAFRLRESVAGHDISIDERLSGAAVYMRLPNLPALARVTGGKQWIKLDFNRALGAAGLGGLPTQSSNPAQFLDYLRAVGAKTKRVGTDTVAGAQTTHYHVVVDLDHYPALFSPARRAAAAHGVSALENAIGSHTMPMDAWIDSGNLLRRASFSFSECVQSQRLTLGMTMNLSDYGRQTVPAPPSPSDSYDLTPLLVKTLANYKPGTCGPAA